MLEMESHQMEEVNEEDVEVIIEAIEEETEVEIEVIEAEEEIVIRNSVDQIILNLISY
jgi:hypothetical protein